MCKCPGPYGIKFNTVIPILPNNSSQLDDKMLIYIIQTMANFPSSRPFSVRKVGGPIILRPYPPSPIKAAASECGNNTQCNFQTELTINTVCYSQVRGHVAQLIITTK